MIQRNVLDVSSTMSPNLMSHHSLAVLTTHNFGATMTPSVTAITKTTNRHDSILESVGDSDNFNVRTGSECKGEKFKNVVFCAPPSGFEDYPAAVDDAISNLWAGPSEGGTFIFTSSGGM